MDVIDELIEKNKDALFRIKIIECIKMNYNSIHPHFSFNDNTENEKRNIEINKIKPNFMYDLKYEVTYVNDNLENLIDDSGKLTELGKLVVFQSEVNYYYSKKIKNFTKSWKVYKSYYELYEEISKNIKSTTHSYRQININNLNLDKDQDIYLLEQLFTGIINEKDNFNNIKLMEKLIEISHYFKIDLNYYPTVNSNLIFNQISTFINEDLRRKLMKAYIKISDCIFLEKLLILGVNYEEIEQETDMVNFIFSSIFSSSKRNDNYSDILIFGIDYNNDLNSSTNKINVNITVKGNNEENYDVAKYNFDKISLKYLTKKSLKRKIQKIKNYESGKNCLIITCCEEGYIYMHVLEFDKYINELVLNNICILDIHSNVFDLPSISLFLDIEYDKSQGYLYAACTNYNKIIIAEVNYTKVIGEICLSKENVKFAHFKNEFLFTIDELDTFRVYLFTNQHKVKILISRYYCGIFNYSEYSWDSCKIDLNIRKRNNITNFMKFFSDQELIFLANDDNKLTILDFKIRNEFHDDVLNDVSIRIAHTITFDFTFRKINDIIDVDIIDFNDKKYIAIAFSSNSIFIMYTNNENPDFVISSNFIADDILSIKFITEFNQNSLERSIILILSCITVNGCIKFFTIPSISAYDKFFQIDNKSSNLILTKQSSFEFQNLGNFLNLINSDNNQENECIENQEFQSETNSNTNLISNNYDLNKESNKNDENEANEDDEEDEIINKLMNLNKSINSNDNNTDINSNSNFNNNINCINNSNNNNEINKKDLTELSSLINQTNAQLNDFENIYDNKHEYYSLNNLNNELFTNESNILKFENNDNYVDEEIIHCDDLFGWYEDIIIQNELKIFYLNRLKNNHNNYDFNIFH